MTQLAKKLKYPYVSMDKKVRQGQPVISGTGIRVLDIAIRYEVMGMTPEDILVSFPHLTLSQIHDALAFYYDHKFEMDERWKYGPERNRIGQRNPPLPSGEKNWPG